MKLRMPDIKDLQDGSNSMWLKPGDIMLSCTNVHNPFVQAILLFTRMRNDGRKPRFSHCMIHVGEGIFINSQFKVVLTPFSYIEKHTDRWIVLRNTTLSEDNRKQLALSALLHYGMPYDVLHLFGFAMWKVTNKEWFRRKLQVPYDEVCSTLVASVYNTVGVHFNEKEDKDVTPDDIDRWCSTHPDSWKLIRGSLNA